MDNDIKKIIENDADVMATNIDFINQQEEKIEELNRIRKHTRYWRYFSLFWLFILLVILLYSCAISRRRDLMIPQGNMVKYYSAVYEASAIGVSKEALLRKTTDDLLEESKTNGYVANCIEFYFDPADNKVYDLDNSEGSTDYYSIEDLDRQIVGQNLIYNLKALEPSANYQNSITKVANTTFTYGFMDGSSQMAMPDTDKAVFSGYSKKLIDKYMSQVSVKNVENAPVTIVIEGQAEVTEEFLDAMLNGVFKDSYMEGGSTTSYYGLSSSVNGVSYIQSNQESVDISDLMIQNIREYLNSEVAVSFEIPKKVTEPLTIIYLSTENFAYDNFYIASQASAY